MRIVTVRIEDNSDKINEVKKLENMKYEVTGNIINKIDELQEEGFMQILAYIKCAYEDYVGIVGKKRQISESCWHNNTLDVSDVSGSIRICAGEAGCFIDFNYAGTLSCGKTPPRMVASFKNDNIIIKNSTRQGICDLMNDWQTIKPEFQIKIDNAYQAKTKEIKSDVNSLEYLLKVAEQFKA